jgi:hypothetical protein
MTRMADLLRKAAEGLEQNEDPFSGPFLAGNDVTFDELLDLAGLLAVGAQAVAWGLDNPRDAAAFIQSGANGMHLQLLTDLLAKVNLTAAGRGTGG